MSSEPSTSTGLEDARVSSRDDKDNTAEHSRAIEGASNKPNEKVPSSEVKQAQTPDAAKVNTHQRQTSGLRLMANKTLLIGALHQKDDVPQPIKKVTG